MTAALSKLVPSPIESVNLTHKEINALFNPVRREARIDEVRCAEYTPFPRIRAEQRPRIGFTRDLSPLGMCLGVDDPEEIGALFRIELRDLDGHSSGATIGRVAWCESARDGRYWVGLDLLCATDAIESKRLTPRPRPAS
jgi:hypothetical protein